MLDVFDPTSSRPVRGLVAAWDLSDEAQERLEGAANLRGFVDRLLTEGLAADALKVISRALPAPYTVAWCCECVRNSLQGNGAAIDTDRAGVKLAEQCLADPSDANRQLCVDFARAARYGSAGAWVATAAAWVEGSLSPVGGAPVPAPHHAVGEAAMAALRMAAARAGEARDGQLAAYAERALSIFGTP